MCEIREEDRPTSFFNSRLQFTPFLYKLRIRKTLDKIQDIDGSFSDEILKYLEPEDCKKLTKALKEHYKEIKKLAKQIKSLVNPFFGVFLSLEEFFDEENPLRLHNDKARALKRLHGEMKEIDKENNMKDEMRFYDLQGTGTMSQMNETYPVEGIKTTISLTKRDGRNRPLQHLMLKLKFEKGEERIEMVVGLDWFAEMSKNVINIMKRRMV